LNVWSLSGPHESNGRPEGAFGAALGNEPKSIKRKWDKIGGKRKFSSIFEAEKK
jgi:hypothetical protein